MLNKFCFFHSDQSSNREKVNKILTVFIECRRAFGNSINPKTTPNIMRKRLNGNENLGFIFFGGSIVRMASSSFVGFSCLRKCLCFLCITSISDFLLRRSISMDFMLNCCHLVNWITVVWLLTKNHGVESRKLLCWMKLSDFFLFSSRRGTE